MSADSTSDERADEVPAPILPGILTIGEVMAFLDDYPDLSMRDINAVLVGRQVSETVTAAQLYCLRVVIQTGIAIELSLYSQVV